MRKERVGFAMCGSFCTHEKVLAELEKLVQLYETVIPIASEISAFTDTRFGTSDDLMERLEDLTGHEVLCDIPSVEPIGPKGLLDVLVIAPATGNTIAKLAAGITATAGIGSNLYLCKVAMDIMAKHVQPDKDGVRIAELDEMSYREQLWAHRPLTDFWRVGRGYAKKLEAIGIYTMGDVARCSIGKPNEYYNEELLYRMFGINAELLIDHAWGWEPCRMQDIKAYRPETNSICSGQVLQCPYSFEKARLVVREMAEAVALDLLEKKLVTDQLTLTVGYDIENTTGGSYHGEIVTDRYGRKIPKHTHGTANLPRKTSSARSITDAVLGVYDAKVNPKLSIRRLTITANRLVGEDTAQQEPEAPVQFNLFDNVEVQEQRLQEEEAKLKRERKIQEAMLDIKKKFGKNAILNGGSYLEGATAKERNKQIGGHKA